MSGIGFGSDVVAAAWYAELVGLSAVTSVVGTRLANLTAYPLGYQFPACIFYMEAATYAGAISGGENVEEMRWVTRFTCEGESNEAIKSAAVAALDHFRNLGLEYYYGGESYWIESNLLGEWPLTSEVGGQTMYRALGFFCSVRLLHYS